MATSPSALTRYRSNLMGYAPLDQADQSPPGQGPGSPAPQPPSIYGNLGNPSIPALNTDPNGPIHNMYYNDQAIENAGGDQINNEALAQLGYYGPIQAQYQQKADQSLADLQQTPGYTPQEAGQINVDYGQYRQSPQDLAQQYLSPDEQRSIYGDPSAAVSAMQQGMGWESGALQKYGDTTQQAYKGYGTALDKATGALGSGLNSAQGKFAGLDRAAGSSKLEFDPNNTERQLSDADVQEMKTAAGARIGNQYQAAEDTLERQAAANGNASPLAMAAARSRLMTHEAADQGDAEVNADIGARQAQYQRAAGIEGQREGAAQYQTGLQAQASTTEEAAAQNAAALAGTQGIQAAENYGQSGVNLASQFGQFATNTAANVANQGWMMANNADTLASQRASQIAGNRQNVYGNILGAQYGQNMQTTQATSQGAQTVGQARMGGQAAYRQGVTQQQGLAQQGGQSAMQQQAQAYATRSGALNQSTAARGQYQNTGNTFSNQFGQIASGLSHFLEEGGIVNEPTDAVVGERGPELIVPMGRYRGKRAA